MRIGIERQFERNIPKDQIDTGKQSERPVKNRVFPDWMGSENLNSAKDVVKIEEINLVCEQGKSLEDQSTAAFNEKKNEVIYYGKSFICGDLPGSETVSIPHDIRSEQFVVEINKIISNNPINPPKIIIRDEKSGLDAQLAFFMDEKSNKMQPVLFFMGLGEFKYSRNICNALTNICGGLPIDMEAASVLSKKINDICNPPGKKSKQEAGTEKYKELIVGGYSKGGALATYVGAEHGFQSFSINGLPLGRTAQNVYNKKLEANKEKFEGNNSILITGKGDWVAQGNCISCLISLFSCCKNGKSGKEKILHDAGGHANVNLPDTMPDSSVAQVKKVGDLPGDNPVGFFNLLNDLANSKSNISQELEKQGFVSEKMNRQDFLQKIFMTPRYLALPTNYQERIMIRLYNLQGLMNGPLEKIREKFIDIYCDLKPFVLKELISQIDGYLSGSEIPQEGVVLHYLLNNGNPTILDAFLNCINELTKENNKFTSPTLLKVITAHSDCEKSTLLKDALINLVSAFGELVDGQNSNHKDSPSQETEKINKVHEKSIMLRSYFQFVYKMVDENHLKSAECKQLLAVIDNCKVRKFAISPHVLGVNDLLTKLSERMEGDLEMKSLRSTFKVMQCALKNKPIGEEKLLNIN